MRKTTYLIDEPGIELRVIYDLTIDPAYNAEPGNPSTYVQETYEIEIEHVDLIIARKAIDITNKLTQDQIHYLLNQINNSEWLSSHLSY